MRKKAMLACQTLSFLAALGILLSGCGSSYIDIFPAPTYLTYPIIGVQDITTLDPALASGLASVQAIELIYSGLVSLNPRTLQVIPDIATGWDVSNGGKTYTFHLRKGIKFSNGDPVDASTFAYSIDRALDPATGSRIATRYLGHILGAVDRHAGKIPTIIGTSVVVVNSLTLQINLDAPIGFFLQALAASPSWAVDKHVVQQYGAAWSDEHAVGTGPFMLNKDLQQPGDDLTFVQNPHWYGKKLTLTRIDMRLIADTSTAFNDFQTKLIDVDTSVDPADYSNARVLGPNNFFEGPALTMRYLAPNSAIAPFNNLTVRQAFAEAVDRDTIANQTLRGLFIPSDHIVPQGMPGYFAGLKGLSFNPQDARAKLAQVYPDLRTMPAVTLEYARGGDDEKVAAKLQQDFQSYLGVHIKLHPVNAGQLARDVSTRKVQFALLNWSADYSDPQDWLSLQVAGGAPNNTMNFNDPGVDQLIAQADVTQDQAQRFALYNQAEELAVDEVAWIPYAQSKYIYLFQKYVRGFSQDAEGLTPDSAWPDVSIRVH